MHDRRSAGPGNEGRDARGREKFAGVLSVDKMVYSEYTKRRFLFHNSGKLSVNDIVKALLEEAGVWKFLRKYKESGGIGRKPGSGTHSKVDERIKKIVDKALEDDNESTGMELSKIVKENGYNLSISTVLRCRRKLGWTCRGSAYCQLIREVNKAKRLEWARKCIDDDFANVMSALCS